MTPPRHRPGNGRARILVVDDSLDTLRLLVTALQASGYKACPVSNGAAALSAAAATPPDLILLDVCMPDLDGYEVCSRLKSMDRLKDVPVIFLSALTETLDKVRAFAVGGVDYITKPVDLEEARQRIATHLNLRRMQVTLERQTRELAEQCDQLRKLEAVREDLTRLIVHDLRAPLTGVCGYLELLTRARPLNERHMEFVETAYRNSMLLSDLIDTLLDVGRLEEGKMPLAPREHDLHVLALAAVGALGALNAERRVRVRKPDQPLRVSCDGEIIRRVMTNLMSNALRYTQPPGPVHVELFADSERARVEVRDEGPGIAAEHLEKVFEKYGQAGPRLSSSSGLGLSFCRLAVEAHGGKIGLSSTVGKGSTFWFELGMGPSAGREAGEDSDSAGGTVWTR